MSVALQDYRYYIIERGNDADIVDSLDFWLENWIFRKNCCPACGNFNENDEYDSNGTIQTGPEPVEKVEK